MIDPMVSSDSKEMEITPEKTILGIIKAQRNVMYIICFFLITLLGIAISFAWSAHNDSMSSKELIYVKLYPEGKWEVDEFKPQDKQFYQKNMIDKILKEYVENRFGVQPTTISRDYGAASYLMDDALKNEFMSPQGFDAVQKAANAQSKSNDITKITWRFNLHTQTINGEVKGKRKDIVRTTVYFLRQRNKGLEIGEPEKMMLMIQWYLMDKSDIEKKDKSWINVNPIGLKIIDEKLRKEPDLEKK